MAVLQQQNDFDPEQLFKLTFENAAVGMTQVDITGHYIRVNQKMGEITGYSKEELLQKTFQEITHPDDIKEDLRQAQMLRRGEINSYSIEKRYLKKDGNIIWIKVTVSAITAAKGEVKFIISVVEDINLRKEAEIKLQESEKKFRTLANNISQLAWMADNEGKIFWYNKRWLDYTGNSPQKITGWGWRSIIHPDHLKRVKNSVDKSLKTGKDWEELVPLKNIDGDYRWFIARSIPERDENHNIICWFGTATDITKQRKIEELLKKDKELVENLLYIAAHDLKGPVANMHGFFEVMDKMEPEQKLTILEHFRRIADQLINTISGITEILRVRDTDKSLARVVYFKNIFNDVLLEFRDRLTPFSVNIDIKEKTAIRYIEPFLYSIIKNLVSNSIKYSRDDVPLHIEISIGKEENYTLLTISDNGIGINLNKYGKKLFSPFQRFEIDKATGTGMGLYLIKSIIEKNGGYINVESTPGEGTTFFCYLKEY